MSEQEGYEQEEFEQQDESFEQEESQEETKVDPTLERLDRLESMIQKMMSGQQTQPTKQERQGLTAEQIAAFKDNPEAMLRIIEDQRKQITNELNLTLQQKTWDDKAKQDFPALNNDSKFKSLVKKHIEELVSDGGMNANTPRLLYVAAKLAASEYQPKSQETAKKADTSAIRPGAKKANTSPTDKQKAEIQQKTYLLKMSGYSDEKIGKMIENYEKRSREYTTRSGIKRRFTQL